MTTGFPVHNNYGHTSVNSQSHQLSFMCINTNENCTATPT